MIRSALSRTDSNGTKRRLVKFEQAATCAVEGPGLPKFCEPGWYWVNDLAPTVAVYDPVPATDLDIRQHYDDWADRQHQREYGFSAEAQP